MGGAKHLNKWAAIFGLFTLVAAVAVIRSASASPNDEPEPIIGDSCLEDRVLTAELTKHVPPQVAARVCKKIGKPAPGIELGPNCFTAAMLWYDPNQPLEFKSGDQFNEFLKGFEETDRAHLRTGDLVVFEREDMRVGDDRYYTHAAVYLKGDLVWNKLGPTKLFDHGEGPKWIEPAWTYSSIVSLADKFDTSTPVFFRRK